MNAQSETAEYDRQLNEARSVREFAHVIAEGKHANHFERKDYIGFALFNRCLQTHEAIQYVVSQSLLDDGWVLVRTLVEHAVNSAYMFYVADAATADNFADYLDHLAYTTLLDLKATDEAMVRKQVSVEEEEKLRLRYEAVRAKFDGKRGDKWCVDDALYKRAARIDATLSAAKKERVTDFLWLVNSIWRYASTYTHGTAFALADQLSEGTEGVIIHRKYTYGEGAKVLQSANAALYFILLPVDVRLGGKHAAELNERFKRWVGPNTLKQ
jgi:hypothetical protein